MRIALQPAFVLHQRPYRETSVLLELFTQDFGRVGLVARGVRKNRSVLKPLLQPFNPLLLSWQGKTELMTLTAAEANGMPYQLKADCLLSGLYLNELLMRVLHKHDAHSQLYAVYQQTLLELQGPVLQQKTLRLFEKKLLEELGYGLRLDYDISTSQPLRADTFYRYHPELGFGSAVEMDCLASTMVFSGKSLIALAEEQLDDAECLQDIKRLMRFVLAPLIGQQPLNSRKLFK